MPINYYLRPNTVSSDPKEYIAKIFNLNNCSLDKLIKGMLLRGTTVGEADIEAVLNLFFKEIIKEVCEGRNVNLPIVSIRPSIKGKFNGAHDLYDSSRHKLKLDFRSGLILRESINKVAVNKISRPIKQPLIQQYRDINSDTIDSIITPGGIGHIYGEELKFTGNNDEEGLFFIAADESRIKVTVFSECTKGKHVFSIPKELIPGNYILEVRKNYSKKNNRIRMGRLQDLLFVS